MKKGFLCFLLPLCFLAACKKDAGNTVSYNKSNLSPIDAAKATLKGSWNENSLIDTYYDKSHAVIRTSDNTVPGKWTFLFGTTDSLKITQSSNSAIESVPIVLRVDSGVTYVDIAIPTAHISYKVEKLTDVSLSLSATDTGDKYYKIGSTTFEAAGGIKENISFTKQ